MEIITKNSEGQIVKITNNHNDLQDRNTANQHSISAISGLQDALNGKVSTNTLNASIASLENQITNLSTSQLASRMGVVESTLTANATNMASIESKVENISLVENDDNTLTFTDADGEETIVRSGNEVDNDTIELTDGEKIALKKVYVNAGIKGNGITDNPLEIDYDNTTLQLTNNKLDVKGIRDASGTVLTADDISDGLDLVESSIETVSTNLTTTNTNLNQLQKKVDGQMGVGGYLIAYNFGKEIPTQSELNSYALQQIFDIPSSHTATEIWNGTKVVNTYNNSNTLWLLTNTPNTNPAVFEWTSQGNNNVSLATSKTAGLVKGSQNDLKGAIDVNGELSINGLASRLSSCISIPLVSASTVSGNLSAEDFNLLTSNDNNYIKTELVIGGSVHTEKYYLNTNASEDNFRQYIHMELESGVCTIKAITVNNNKSWVLTTCNFS